MLASVVSLSGCAENTGARGTASLATYDNGTLRFTHPSSWRPQPYENVSNFSNLIIYLSTDQLHAPCTTTTGPDGRITACGWPVTQLSAGGVLVSWSAGSGVGWKVESVPGQTMTIAGRPGKLAITKPGACGQIGGDETMTATIATGGSSYYEMLACLRAQSVVAAEQQVRAMISSTRLNTPASSN